MRVPIAHALAYPERFASGVAGLDLFQIARLDFRPPDVVRFPCLRLAYDALAAGGTATAILNAANEVAVAAFLERRIAFPGIARINAEVLHALPTESADMLETVLAADARARTMARAMVGTAAE
jgi:1-deoxy-D-xylulose-5-phosphate reductoisomerase